MRTVLRHEKQEAMPRELSCDTKNKKSCRENCLATRKAKSRAGRTALRHEKQEVVPGELPCDTKSKKSCRENCPATRKTKSRAGRTALRHKNLLLPRIKVQNKIILQIFYPKLYIK